MDGLSVHNLHYSSVLFHNLSVLIDTFVWNLSVATDIFPQICRSEPTFFMIFVGCNRHFLVIHQIIHIFVALKIKDIWKSCLKRRSNYYD